MVTDLEYDQIGIHFSVTYLMDFGGKVLQKQFSNQITVLVDSYE